MALLHPIITLAIKRPDLLVEHLSGYAGLLREEASSVGTEVAKRAIAGAIAAVCALVFLVLAGVAIMLGALVGQFHWTLLVVPLVPLVVAILGLVEARRKLPHAVFVELRSQLDADARTLRDLNAS